MKVNGFLKGLLVAAAIYLIGISLGFLAPAPKEGERFCSYLDKRFGIESYCE